MANKTAAGLVKHMKKCLQDGWGYVYGAIGQTCTERLLDQCAERYPANNLAGGAMRQAGEKWLGKKVADCSGIVKAYLMSEYTGGPLHTTPKWISAVHYNACQKKRGPWHMPDIPGILVYMPMPCGRVRREWGSDRKRRYLVRREEIHRGKVLYQRPVDSLV